MAQPQVLDDQQIQEIANRVIDALNGLQPIAPAPKEWWEHVASFGSWAALAAAGIAFWIGWLSLQHQKAVLSAQNEANANTLEQKREADARSEWWRRTQWALEASASENDEMYSYGTGMLDLLARSELASPKDKELLDAVWEVTDTEMQDDSIEQLIDEASRLNGLDEEEAAVVRSFYNVDDTPDTGENEDKHKSRDEREEEDGSAHK
ncbi:hypothetical protein [Paenarthrobacter ureafaciens]|uniref:hypothetical protein n=1 Tax=Paenarthrobacter ureafaciens TaxID=37931 RepID=UPI002DB61AD4|nr:hypothetical protein [Paenarthrobacter ureafaciens]MEC3851278.1 hypothetical protein [Paenarthrobacter ureafaciens]